MAINLQIKLSLQSEAKVLLVEDVTGISTLAGSDKWSGGGLNTNFQQGDVDLVVLDIFVGDAVTPKVLTATELPQTGFSVLPAMLEQQQEQIKDSVYKVRYMPFFLSFNNNVVVQTSNNAISVNSADKSIIVSRGITLLRLAGVIYEVNLAETIAAGATTVVLKTAFQETSQTITPANIYVGYYTEDYVLNDRATVDCITKIMGSIKLDTSCCKACKKDFINRFNDLNIARFNFDVGLYSNAQQALEFVLRNCEKSPKNCGCG